jgi:NADH-quinone oxidoreductase subunit A
MLTSYFPIGLVLLVATVMAVVMVALAALASPRRPSAIKASPFECGSDPIGSARERFGVKFYVVAILFVVFDIEAIFLYPWAVLLLPDRAAGLPGLGWAGFATMGIFVATLLAGLVYVWKKGALDWSE